MKLRSLLPCLGLLLLSACSDNKSATTNSTTDNSSKPEAKPAAITIAMIPKGTTHVFWKTVESGARKAAEEAGVTLKYVGTEKEDDRQQQQALVKTQILGEVQGICLAPLDSVALKDPVSAAKKANIPVVIFDSPLAESDEITSSFVGTDNFHAGGMAAKGLAAALGEKGKVIMLRYQQGSASTEARENGFLDELKKFPGITVVSSEQYGGATVASALDAAKNLLLRFSGENAVDGIYCPNQSTTYGMLQALQQSGNAGKVKFVGFDPTIALVESLKKGDITGIVAQDPYKMGNLAVKTLVSVIKGEKVERTVDTGAAYVTPENVDTAEIQAIIKPQMN